MTNAMMYEQLDNAINRMFAGTEPAEPMEDRTLAGLVGVAQTLRCLPRVEFRERLLLDLEAKAHTLGGTRRVRSFSTAAVADALPTLTAGGIAEGHLSRMNVVASVSLHALAVALVVGSGYLAVEQRVVRTQVISLVNPDVSALPPAPDLSKGGGGGGDRDKLDASNGALPKLSHEQITPPAAVVRNEKPLLEVAPSIIVPNLPAPQLPQIGDPTSQVAIASNGIGSRGGIGTGSGGGIGTGTGVGLGPGSGAGTGGGVYRVGGGVSAPRPIYSPDPDYSEEARKAKIQGIVVLWTIVGPDGRPRDIRVQRSLGMGLDEKAVEAVRTWRFEPARKNDQAVAVQINVEVSFRLY